jgi:hypothetical protein
MIAGPASQGRRQVLVYKLNGSEPITGELTELKKTGVRLALAMPLGSGEVVRLIMPPRAHRALPSCRTIIGHVVTTASSSSGHLVGIDFGWQTGVGVGSRSAARPPRRPWWRRILSGGAAEGRAPRPARLTRGRWTSR